jgi:hypothetical protein
MNQLSPSHLLSAHGTDRGMTTQRSPQLQRPRSELPLLEAGSEILHRCVGGAGRDRRPARVALKAG